MKPLLLFVLLSASSLSFAQLPELIPYRKGNLWGYCDSTKKMIIEPKFKGAWGFQERIIDPQTEAKIKFAYVVFENEDKVIDTKRNFIELNEEEEENAMISRDNTDVVFERFLNKYNSKYIIEGNGYRELIKIRDRATQLYGFINWKKEEIIIPCIYENVTDFEKSTTTVALNKKWGCINFKGEIVIPMQYQEIIKTDNLLLCNKEDGKWEVFNYSGGKKEDLNPELVSKYLNSTVSKIGDKYGAKDENNQISIPFVYNYLRLYEIYFYEASKDGKDGIIDANNKPILDFKYNNISINKYRLLNHNQLFVIARIENKWGVVKENDKVLLDFHYDKISMLYDSFVLQKESKTGYYDIDYNLLIPCLYDYVREVEREGLFIVELDGKKGYIDRYGTKYWED